MHITNRFFIPMLLLFCVSAIIAQPHPGTIVVNSDYGAAIAWDGFGLQEKQLSEMYEFSVIVDSEEILIDTCILKYRHIVFGPTVDIGVYVHSKIALGAGYAYQYTTQFLKVPHRLKNNPGGYNVSSSHHLRGAIIWTPYQKCFDEVDVIGVPYYLFGVLTRMPLVLEWYKDVMPLEAYEIIDEIHKSVSYMGYGFEIRARGRHFLNNLLFVNGSIYIRVQKMIIKNDPFEEYLSSSPQGGFGLGLGMGVMIGGGDRKEWHRKEKNKLLRNL